MTVYIFLGVFAYNSDFKSGVYIFVQKRYLFPKMIFFHSCHMPFFLLLSCLLALILLYFEVNYPFTSYFLFFILLFPFSSPSFLSCIFSSPLHIFAPNDRLIFPPGEGWYFPIYRPLRQTQQLKIILYILREWCILQKDIIILFSM
jgi:hypothetical protein